MMFIVLATASNKIWAFISILPILIIAAVITYFLLPSRNLLSILWGNTFYGIFYLTLAFQAYDDDDDASSKFLMVGIPTLVILFLVCIGGSLHSHMSVKPTWDSIPKEYSKSTEAPTFKRNETPIALAPKTVINRVRKASSDIPNTQYYSISDEIQSQYYKGKPVYVIPIEYNGFFQSNRAGEIPGYFIIDATRQNATPRFVKKPYYYAVSGYFNKDASRQIYRHNPSWLSLDTPQLEIDDNGDPYWVQTVYKSEPSWVMTILDSTHAIRGYYYLDASDQSVYGTGSNPTSALDSFRQALVDSGASAGNTPGEKKKNFSGVIDRAAVVSNKNKAMFMLKGKNIIFTVNTNDYDFANLIRPGDKVKFSANVVKGKSIGSVNEFKDESLD